MSSGWREVRSRYEAAFLDWASCAVGAREEPVALAAATIEGAALERVVALGTAGHVLDFDDTYLPGAAHLSAPIAPAALVLGASLDLSFERVLGAFAEGFEVMGKLARAGSPELYERGWHPTALCGTAGAAVAAARLLGLEGEDLESAIGLALLRASGLRASFGGHGKSVQVGMAAAEGLLAARLAAGGVRISLAEIGRGFAGYETTVGASFPEGLLEPSVEAISQNWLKPWPCCLQTHGPIEAAAQLRRSGDCTGRSLTVKVRPFARQAARYDDVESGLQAKFSIPYMVAFTVLHGEPRVEDLRDVLPEVRNFATEHIEIATVDGLEPVATIECGGSELVRVTAPLGSPMRPLDPDRRAAKIHGLGADSLARLLAEEPSAAAVLAELETGLRAA